AVVRTGNVGLFDAGHHVFQGHQHQRRGSTAQITQAAGQAFVIVGGGQLLLLQGTVEDANFLGALLPGGSRVFGIDLSGLLVPVDVMSVKPARGGRQVVSAGGGQRLGRPLAGQRQDTVLLLELQYPHAENAASAQYLLQSRGYRAQVLADDQCAVPPGFQGEQPQKVIHRIAQVGTAVGAFALGDDPQPLQAHDVVYS